MKVQLKQQHHTIIFIVIVLIFSIGISLYYICVLVPTSQGKAISSYQTQQKKPALQTPKQQNNPLPAYIIPKIIPDYSIPSQTDGLAPVISKLPTKQNVVFLGIDDGAFKDPSVISIMKENHIKASLFLSKAFIASDPDFFKQLVDIGSVIENHTLSHDTNMVNTQNYDQQKAEICSMADYEELHYGHRPTLFRPPGGSYSTITRQAAADCGMKAVVIWIAKAGEGSMQYQVSDKLQPGDIVLLHFRPEFKQDLEAFIGAMKASGLHTALARRCGL